MPEIDWAKEVEARKEDLFSDLFEVLKINSVKDMAHATEEFPVGPGAAEAMLKFLSLAERDGFRTKNLDNLVGYLEYGDSDAEAFGLLGHMDVVPVDDKWTTDPFDPVIKDGKLYARGASDDKGPSMAAYYAVKIIKELGLPISKKIRFIVGTDEESGWACMNHYLELEEMPKIGFSPDAEFPIINGEKAIIGVKTVFPTLDGAGDMKLENFTAGLALNMVPPTADAVVAGAPASIEADFVKFLADNELTGEVKFDGEKATFHVVGVGVHAMDPTVGKNSATFLAAFLNNYSFDATAANFLKVVSEYYHLVHHGEKLGVAFEHPVMGNVTTPANLFKYAADGEKSVILNVRFPEGTDVETIEKQMSEVLNPFGVTVSTEPGGNRKPHYLSGDDPLVKTLLDVYEKHTGLKGFEESIGGGTYGRLLEHGVAYGALFQGRENVMHQPNEYMFVEDIIKSATIYADAIYRLVK
ncbi:MAG: dipeptidase PepV [Streptococcaceae bacterium]|jgi:dipeptidase D|nr:dipeptidase PepV [Streptococcaceae bacterium]